MVRRCLWLAILLVAGCGAAAQPAEPPQRPGYGFNRIADLPTRILAVAYFSAASLERCYFGTLRAVNKAQMDEAIRMVRETETAVVAVRPDLDIRLLYHDALQLGVRFYATSRDPAPWICARDITAIVETHKAATTGTCPGDGRWPNCR